MIGLYYTLSTFEFKCFSIKKRKEKKKEIECIKDRLLI